MKLAAKLATLAAIVGVFAALTGGFAGAAKSAVYPVYPISIKALKPDLVVSSDGSTVRVVNQGTVNAGGFYVAVGKSSGNTCWLDGSQTQYVPGLAANTAYTFRLQTTSDAPRTVVVDSTNLVSETNETNNTSIIPAVFTAC
jgi:hypothetical protein